MASAVAIITVINAFAPRYGVRPSLAVSICRRESGFKAWAVGDDGKAVGPWQWHLESWEHVRRAMGRPTGDMRKDVIESTETALYAMGVMGLYGWWSTYPAALAEVG